MSQPVYDAKAGEAEMIVYLEEALALARARRLHQLVLVYDEEVADGSVTFTLKTMLCSNQQHYEEMLAKIRENLDDPKPPERVQLNG
jgi:hypothetical protein